MYRLLRFFLLLALTITTSLHAQQPPSPALPSPPPAPRDRVVICIDRSASMGSRGIAEIRAAIAQAINDPSGQDLPFEIAITAFGDSSAKLLDFTHRRADILDSLNRLVVEIHGKTRLYDAVARAAAELRAAGAGSKRILIVSDGRDSGSAIAFQRLLTLLSTDVGVDAIAFGSPGTPPSAGEFLARMTGATGGRYVEAWNPGTLGTAMSSMLKPVVVAGTPGMVTPPTAVPAPGNAAPSSDPVPALHSVKVNVRAATDAKCLQLAYGVAVDSLQDVKATTTLVSGRLGAVNLSISCVALGADKPAVALVTAAGGTTRAATQAGESIAARLAAAIN